MKNKIYYIFICVFLFIIITPFWGILLNNDGNNTENRTLTKITNVKGIHSLNQYITDNHGFRELLSNSCIYVYMNLLKESPIPNLVELGKNGFFFLGNKYNDTYSSSLGVAKFKENDVMYAYNNILEVQRFCDEIGVDLYLVIAPNKASIYPEYLKLKPNNTPRLKDKLIKKLEQTSVNFIDLTPFLEIQKQQARLYYKYDSHWNDYGALLATKEVVDNISKKHNIKPINESDYTIEKKTYLLEFDLSKIINVTQADSNYYEVKLKQEILIEEKKHLHRMTFFENKSNKNGIKSFVISDSFFTAMFTPYMSSIETASIFKTFASQDIAIEIARVGKPDFILYEVVERNVNLVAIQ